MNPQEALQRVIEHREIFQEEMIDLMRQIMSGQMSPTLISGILIGLRVKKETIGEITGAALVMRELGTKVPLATDRSLLVDTCGTGGDGAHTFNISTTAMFVAAAAGAKVAKHGGRAVSSCSGSADALESLGVHLALTPEQVGAAIDEIGLGFMFAPNFNSAMRHAGAVRRELGVRTMFNILGPLTNPAGAANQVMGVFHPDLVGIQARVLQRLGSRNALIVHGLDGLDELSISAPTLVGELRDGVVREYRLSPEDVGLALHPASAVRADTVEDSRALLLAALDGSNAAARDIVAFNAGASLYVGGNADTLESGVARALEVIASGAARAKLDELVRFTGQFK
ncbi:anthranilate phosphoribosyltransferase [Niveibacterium terrae]|uniref:anthranilate phosphoribosyltransferase n=1 Tax=Niveibacterium terrae TaxID=3373598 RepID=UPI003A8E68E8